ncbi:MAG: molybdopterin synthase [Halobacteriales archaeon]
MKVVEVRSPEAVDIDAGLEALAAVLDAPVAVSHLAVVDGEAVVRTRVGTRRSAHRAPAPELAELEGDLVDDLADDGVRHALLAGDVRGDWPVVHLGSGGDDAGVAVDPGDLVGTADVPPALRRALDEAEPHETLASLIETAIDHPEADRAGAIATFTGRVRADNLEGHTTTYLEYEKYETVADEALVAIREELLERDGVVEVLLHHHTGVVPAGEDAVYVVVLAGHREEAFATCEDGIDLLKERVPIFKKEVTESGEYWAHDRP